MSAFKPLLRSRPEKGPEQYKRNGNDAALIILKDQLSIQVWLSIGALFNGLLWLAIGRIALLIPVIIVATRLINTLLIALKLKSNPLMNGVITNKYSAQIPNADGTYGPKPANQTIALLLIGTKSNHPLGVFAPGFKQMGDYMTRMQKDVHERAADFGLLSTSQWVGSERASGNEIMFAMYFRSADDIHRFAHEPLHREAWNFYYKLMADKSTDYSHLSIWHEIVEAPAGRWESVYANSQPTLLGAARVPIKSASGETEWHSTVVDATRGPLKSSKGRMAKTDGADNDMYKHAAEERGNDEKLDF